MGTHRVHADAQQLLAEMQREYARIEGDFVAEAQQDMAAAAKATPRAKRRVRIQEGPAAPPAAPPAADAAGAAALPVAV